MDGAAHSGPGLPLLINKMFSQKPWPQAHLIDWKISYQMTLGCIKLAIKAN